MSLVPERHRGAGGSRNRPQPEAPLRPGRRASSGSLPPNGPTASPRVLAGGVVIGLQSEYPSRRMQGGHDSVSPAVSFTTIGERSVRSSIQATSGEADSHLSCLCRSYPPTFSVALATRYNQEIHHE
jgi:hypothetical protein